MNYLFKKKKKIQSFSCHYKNYKWHYNNKISSMHLLGLSAYVKHYPCIILLFTFLIYTISLIHFF